MKADGLAAGKGVLVTERVDEAAGDWVRRCLAGEFGPAGTTVVIEEFLEGPEVSVFALCAGTDVIASGAGPRLQAAAGRRRGSQHRGNGSLLAGDRTFPAGLVDDTIDQVMKPVLATMAAEGSPYTGFLYAGLVADSRRTASAGVQLPSG